MATNNSVLAYWLQRRDLPGGWARACCDVLEWLATPGASLETCPKGAWLLRFAAQLGYTPGECASAVRPAVLRALRVYAPEALERAGLAVHAQRLRALPDDCDMEQAARAARAAWWESEKVLAEAAKEATEAASWAAEDVSKPSAAVVLSDDESAESSAESASWAAESAATAARVAADAAELEHTRCASDVRAALPDLEERLRAAVARFVEDARLVLRQLAEDKASEAEDAGLRHILETELRSTVSCGYIDEHNDYVEYSKEEIDAQRRRDWEAVQPPIDAMKAAIQEELSKELLRIATLSDEAAAREYLLAVEREQRRQADPTLEGGYRIRP